MKKNRTLLKRVLAAALMLSMLISIISVMPISAAGENTVTVTARSGAELSAVGLLDTLEASAEGATAYKWQISNDGTAWADIDGATTNSFILTADNAGKQIKCLATVGDSKIASEIITVPTYTIQSTGNGTDKMGSFADTAEVNDQGYRNYSKAEDKFKVDGREFVLLDTFANDESAYFVTSTEAYGDLATYSGGDQPSPPFAYNNPDALQPFLDGDFLTQGNAFKALGTNNTTSYKLPTGIVNNINKNHIWYRYVNDHFKSNGVSETFKAGVSQLSYTDFVNYKNKLGLIDVFSDGNLNTSGAYGTAKANAYFIRDTHTWGGNTAFVTFGRKFISEGNFSDDYAVNFWDQGKAKYILLRPAFYLKSSFFKTTKVDLASMGANVKAAIKADCNDADLLNLYGEADCATYFDITEPKYLKTTTRSGAALNNVELLDTLEVEMVGGEATAYKWQIGDGTVWTDVAGANTNSFALTADNSNKLVRCIATVDGEEQYGAMVVVPTYTVNSPQANVTFGTVAETSDPNDGGYRKYTAAADKFKVDGREFVLLDRFANDESAYYITSTEAYGDLKALSDDETPTGAQIDYDAYKTNAFLNGAFLANGNKFQGLSADKTTSYKLPVGIVNNINKNHTWWRYVNDHRKQNGVPEIYKTGVSLLSITDFDTYKGKLGILDVFQDSNVTTGTSDSGKTVADVYFVRDTNSWGGDKAIVMAGKTSDDRASYGYRFWSKWAEQYGVLRPAFYLKNTFFKTTKIDLTTAGANVIAAIKDDCSNEELLNLYDTAACQTYFGITDTAYVKTTTRKGASSAEAKILDTIVATMIGGEATAYKWQISDNGSVWTDISGATANSYVLTANNSGKLVRCVVTVDGTEKCGAPVMVPVYTMMDTHHDQTTPTSLTQSAATNTFKLDNQTFVLLDAYDNDESTYYVTTTKTYGDLYGGYNVTNELDKAITYNPQVVSQNFLSTRFLTDGSKHVWTKDGTGASEDAVNEVHKLPQGIIDNINFNHDWTRFIGPKYTSLVTEPTFKAGVSLLSWTDFTTYKDILSASEVFDSTYVSLDRRQYFLRDTPNNQDDYEARRTVLSFNNNVGQLFEYQTPVAAIRPAFYLKKSFFKNAKIDLATAGSNVINVMKDNYYIEDLMSLYTEAELEAKGFEHHYTIDTSIKYYNGATAETSNIAEAVKAEVSYTLKNNADDGDRSAVLILAAKDENGIKVVSTKDVTITSTDSTDTISIDGIDGADVSDICLYIWDGLGSLKPLASHKTLYNKQ